MRGLLLILTGAVAAPGAAQQTDTLPPSVVQVSLEEAIRRAIDVQPAMVQARGDGANAGAQKRSAFGAFLPTVTVTSGAFRQNDSSIANGFRVAPGVFTYNSSLSANVDLFAGFRRLARYANANATQDAADAGLVNQQFQVTLQTKQEFYNALATEELVLVAAAQAKRAEQQLQISIQKLRAGSATRSDSLRSTVDYGNARIALLEARANLATAQANLGRQIGVDGAVRAAPDSALPLFPDTTALQQTAIERAPAVDEADARARVAAAALWDSRSQYWPTLNLGYRTSSQGINEPWSGFDRNRNLNTLTFSLSWTLFNGFQRELANTQAAVQRDVARANAAETRRRVSAQLTQQIAALGTSYAKISIATDNVAAATEDLRVQQERYRVGASTILDLLTSQANLTQAETALVQSRFDYLIARAQLEALVGRTL